MKPFLQGKKTYYFARFSCEGHSDWGCVLLREGVPIGTILWHPAAKQLALYDEGVALTKETLISIIAKMNFPAFRMRRRHYQSLRARLNAGSAERTQ